MKVVVGYSLYGDVNEYIKGILKNSKKLENLKWTSAVAISKDSLNDSIKNILLEHNIEIFPYTPSISLHGGMIERFFLFKYFKNIDVLFVRDGDSEISTKEIFLMQNFIDDKKSFLHTIRGHPEHDMPLMGGLIGYKKFVFNYLKKSNVKKYFFNGAKKAVYSTDQKLLILIYLKFINNTLIHTVSKKLFFEKVEKIKFHPFNYPGMYMHKKIDSFSINSSTFLKLRNVHKVSLYFHIIKTFLIMKYIDFLNFIEDTNN